MSHYNLAVIVDMKKKKSLSDILNPYCENLDYVPEECWSFASEKKELMERYENGYSEVIFPVKPTKTINGGKPIIVDGYIDGKTILINDGADGEKIYSSIKEFCREISFAEYMMMKEENEEKKKISSYVKHILLHQSSGSEIIYDDFVGVNEYNASTKYYVEDFDFYGYQLRREKNKDVYPSYEEYAKKNHGCDYFEEFDDYGYYYNENAKWDWYSVGGRWSGQLNLKRSLDKETLEILNKIAGERVFDSLISKTEYSASPIYNIDFEAKKEDIDEALDFWNKAILGKTTSEAEEKYCMEAKGLYSRTWYLEKYKTAANYAKQTTSFKTHAVVTPDGKWHEEGEMGWFGIMTLSEDGENWAENYAKNFIEPYKNGDYAMIIVDCHI